jgi:YD repeat-containing protein
LVLRAPVARVLFTLIFPNGTRYTVDQYGYVTQIKDRNGNYMNLTYSNYSGDAWQNLDIYDSFNFPTHVQLSPNHDTITYWGTGNASRTITVNRAAMDTLTRGQPVQTYKALFPDLDGSDTTTYDPVLPSQILLPHGTQYSFEYDVFGGIMSIHLPTGGRYDYTYAGATAPSSPYTDYMISRRLDTRLELADNRKSINAVVSMCWWAGAERLRCRRGFYVSAR